MATINLVYSLNKELSILEEDGNLQWLMSWAANLQTVGSSPAYTRACRIDYVWADDPRPGVTSAKAENLKAVYTG